MGIVVLLYASMSDFVMPSATRLSALPAKMTRRSAIGLPLFGAAPALIGAAQARRPNVIVVITDDHGYGDLSIHGNPVLKTPHIDSIARDGVRFEQFHVSPVCAPTRASLMTGRWNYRTAVVDTYLGRAMMRPSEVTLAECLQGAGYRTGIFGKWHLGDNAPLRPTEQGFNTSVIHRGGGLAQPSSPPNTGYFNPPLERNNKAFIGSGYCTDIFFDEAIRFIDGRGRDPFFAYIATNAPHTPLEIGDEWVTPYKNRGLDATTEKIYGMVANVDHNVGRLLEQLRKSGIERDTILVFLTDNGPQQPRYNAGMRGLKGTVYEGGIRVPCFVRWPGRVKPGSTVAQIAAHVDLMPTLLDACGGAPPKDRKIDGVSLLPAVEGRGALPADRALFFQWHRGDAPEAWRACAVRTQRWKLVNGKELYGMDTDPAEVNDVSRFWPHVVSDLRARYERWFDDVGSDGYDPPRIWIGSNLENPTLLSRQDWRGEKATWDAAGLGHYEVDVRRAGRYNVTLRYPKLDRDAEAVFEAASVNGRVRATAGSTEAKIAVTIQNTGPARFEGRLEADGGGPRGAHYLEVERLR